MESLSVGKISGKRVNITEETSQNNPQQPKVRVENPKNEKAKKVEGHYEDEILKNSRENNPTTSVRPGNLQHSLTTDSHANYNHPTFVLIVHW